MAHLPKGAAMVHQNQIVIDMLTVMTEETQVEAIVTVIRHGTAIMTEEIPRMKAQATTALVMVIHHPATVVATVVPPQREMGMGHQGVAVLAMVVVGIRLVAKAMMEASVIQQVIRQETKALTATTN